MRGRKRQAMGLGTIIDEYQEEHGLSLGELAKKLDLSKSHLSRIRSGDRPYSRPDTLIKLAHGMDMTVDELLARANGSNTPAPTNV